MVTPLIIPVYNKTGALRLLDSKMEIREKNKACSNDKLFIYF